MAPGAVELCTKRVFEEWAAQPHVRDRREADTANRLSNNRIRQRQRSRFSSAMYELYGGLAWLRILFAIGRVDELCVKILNEELVNLIAEKEKQRSDELARRNAARWEGWQDAFEPTPVGQGQ